LSKLFEREVDGRHKIPCEGCIKKSCASGVEV
jgi:hypothetical protein